MRDAPACRGDAVRLLIDVQGAQGSNAARGIGRYSRELALAMARRPQDHDVVIVLNGHLPADTLRHEFSALLPRENIRAWHGPGGTAEETSLDATRRRAAEAIRAEFLIALRPDLVHVSSVFEGWSDDAVTGWPSWRARPPIVATGYDLIPLIRRAEYLDGAWKQGGLAPWYHRCLHEMRLTDAILAISASSRDELIDYLGAEPAHISNIRAGIGAEFRPPALIEPERLKLLHRLGLRSNYILFLGGGDIRKNEKGLVRAYGLLPKATRTRHQLVIVGKTDDAALHATARDADVESSDVALLHFVDDRDLPGLYASCALFVFPSFHEGFGLPAVEAMACGAPVIASNTTSLPEVIGRSDALFDPSDPASIAERMLAVLDNPVFRQELASYAMVRAATFTWSDSAARAWDHLEATHARTRHRASGRRLRLAYSSPVPPRQTGIADYSAELIPELSRHYDVTIVDEADSTDNETLAPNFPVITPERFLAEADSFDRVLYHIGNSHFHAPQMDRLLPEIPGVVTLHDSFISSMRNWTSHHERRGSAGFIEDLYRSHGWPAVLCHDRDGMHAAIRDFPCSLPVLRDAIGVIQHSRHGRDILTSHFGPATTRDIHIIPHLRQRFGGPDRTTARRRLGIPADQFLVCSFGYVSPNKLPSRLLAAWRATGFTDARLVFIGQANDDGVVILKAGAAELNQPLELLWTDHVDIAAYRTWLAAADVAVQLRTESRGETSGAILDCMAAGVATVINSYGSSAELPEDTVAGLPADFTDAALTDTLLRLRDFATRNDIATKARGHIANDLSPRRIAAEYHTSIEAAYANGAAAARYHVTRSLAHSLPADGGSPELWAACARAVVRDFPAAGPTTLLLDASAFPTLRRDDPLGLLIAAVLSTHPANVRTDLVEIGPSGWVHAREKAAALLERPRPPAPDEPASLTGATALLCIVPSEGWYEAELNQLREWRDLGLTLGVLFVAPPRPNARAGISELAEFLYCLKAEDVDPVNAWLARGSSEMERSAVVVPPAAALTATLLRPFRE